MSAEIIQASMIGGNNRTAAKIRLQVYSPGERRFRALKSLALWMGLAAVSIFIPLLHFVLVPGFILLGTLMAILSLKRRSMVLGGRGQCPYCTADFRLFECSDSWPIYDVCTECHRQVEIVKSIN